MKRLVLALPLLAAVAIVGCVPPGPPPPPPACDAEAISAAVFEAYPEPEGEFLLTGPGCVGPWAAGAVFPNPLTGPAPIEVLLHAESGEWVAVDRGLGMCSRQGVPADTARQFGCT